MENRPKDFSKRQFTLHITHDADPGDYPRVKPLLNFKAQPEGYDEDDSDWEGDVTVAPYLDADEKKDYSDKVDVCYSVNAYMQRQHCEYAVKRLEENRQEGPDSRIDLSWGLHGSLQHA